MSLENYRIETCLKAYSFVDRRAIFGPKQSRETDDFSVSELTFQVRYRWQITPLSDLYVVYTRADSRQTDLIRFRDLFRDSWRYPLGDQLVVKLLYRLGS